MSRNLISRRAGVLAAAVATGVIGTAGPAVADVTISPPSAPQGSGQNVHLDVRNSGTSPITRVKLVLPADTPVAEVFPLSVDDWAPQIETRTLDTPLTSIHGGTPVTQTAASITWIAVNGPLTPGRSADLAVALGPLPATSQMAFTVIPTYVDGTVGPAMPPAILQLTPAQPGTAPAHTGHGGATGGSPSAEEAAFAAVVADQGPGFWAVAGWVIAGLAMAGAVAVLVRGRRRRAADETTPNGTKDSTGQDSTGQDSTEQDSTEQDSTEQDSTEKEPIPAGARVTGWSYRDGPD